MTENQVSSEELLNRILDITDGLYNEMRQYESEGVDNHVKIYSLLADLGRTIVGSDRASFWKWDKRTHELVTTAAVGTGEIRIDEGTGLVGKALLERRAIVTNDPYNDPDFNASVDKKTGYVTKSILVMPIVSCKGEYIGVYQAINKLDDENGFDLEADCKRLSLAAFICGLTLESDLFLDDSQHDRLTDIKNRMGFHSDYKSRFLPVLEKRNPDNPVAMIMCDIDFFKKVNDTYGHNAGDEVLREAASRIKSVAVEDCTAFRMGGDEFLVICTNGDRAKYEAVARQICEKMDEPISVNIIADGNKVSHTIQSSVTIGVAEYPKDGTTFDDIIKCGDEAMYDIKHKFDSSCYIFWGDAEGHTVRER